MIPMEDCPYCEKKMPAHVLAKHIPKWHSKEEVTSIQEPKFVNKYGAIKKGEWDWGEITECGACNEKWPGKLLKLHLKIEHGI